MDQPHRQEGFQQAPLRPEVVPEPNYPPPRKKTGLFTRLLWVFLFIALFGSVALNLLLIGVVGLIGLSSISEDGRVQEKYYSLNRHGRDKIAILSIEGTIVSGEGFFRQQIEHARKDIEKGELKAIIVRVVSPGGTISGSDYMLHHLRELAEKEHIPLVVSMGGMAASGGYYVSMCVGDTPDSIFAEPTTWTGSIGVLIPNYNFAELMGKWGIRDDTIASGPLKTMGSPSRPMTPEQQKVFEGLLENSFTQFKEAIKQGRPKFRANPAALDDLATGQIFSADQAVQNGLVDKIGFVEDALDRAIELAHLDKENVKVVEYKAQPHLSDLIFGRTSAKPTLDLAALLETTTPRAYFLCTWLPAIISSGN